jgi:lipopolysaccharide export system protein LptA
VILITNKKANCIPKQQVILYLKFTCKIIIVLLSALPVLKSYAQQPVTPGLQDTVKLIEIIRGQSMRFITVDSVTTLQSLAIGAIVKQGNTTLSADSIVINLRTTIAEAFGNVKINDADSVFTSSRYLKYIGKERIAYLKDNVVFTDHKGVLTTDDLEYNLRTGIAVYKKGGRIVTEKTVLTSTEGVYYSDTKDVYFKKNVHLVDAKYNLKTDSLLYNTQTQIATLIAPTHIVSKEGIIDAKSGTYDLKSGQAIFTNRATFSDKGHSLIADTWAFDEKTGILQTHGKSKLVDSVNNVTILANTIFLNKKDNSFLSYDKPVMILYRDKDSTYIAADTLFSGLRKYDSLAKKEMVKNDTLKKAVAVNTNTADTAIRYFLAFNHVRIFNDSLQAVSDSLYYSTQDSTFKLFRNPVVWNNDTQVTGDTIYLYTEKQKAKRLYVFNNGMVVNELNPKMFNQIGGRTLNGYFIDGNIDFMRVKGSPAESIFYPRDDDSSYTGMNRSSSDLIDIYFVNKEVNKVKFVNEVNGTMYPMNKIPLGQT